MKELDKTIISTDIVGMYVVKGVKVKPIGRNVSLQEDRIANSFYSSLSSSTINWETPYAPKHS